MSEFLMPSLGADMDEGKVVEWLVKPGDPVVRGDVVVLVETEKGIIEVEIWEDGTLAEILVPEGETVDVGTVIAMVTEAGVARVEPEPPEAVGAEAGDAEALADQALPPARMEAPKPPVRHLAHELSVDLAALVGTGPGGAITREDVRAAAERTAAAAAAPPVEPAARPKVTPRAQAVAKELGIDLSGLPGTGPDGAVTARDVKAAAAGGVAAGSAPATSLPQAKPEKPADKTKKGKKPKKPSKEERASQQAAMRHAIAEVMSKSKREIPHYYLGTTVDVSRALSWLESANAERSVLERVLPAALLLKAAALALREVPEMNGFYRDGFEASEDIHLGVAISLRSGGLIAPCIHHADSLALDELMTKLNDLVKRARNGRLRGSEMADPTITITNLGERGVEETFPVIYAPQVAIVGFGKIVERPWAVDGMLAVRPTVRATLAADHRVSDGHRGGLYLAAIDRLLQEPEAL